VIFFFLRVLVGAIGVDFFGGVGVLCVGCFPLRLGVFWFFSDIFVFVLVVLLLYIRVLTIVLPFSFFLLCLFLSLGPGLYVVVFFWCFEIFLIF